MAAPPIPQRPERSRDVPVPAPSSSMEIPSTGARSRRSIDLSASIDRDSFARSPLNEPPFLHKKPSTHGMSSLSRTVSRDLPIRPPSVDFPTIGGEGNEYAQFSEPTEERRTSQVSPDLPLHAPKAALPASVAKAKVGEVVRTNSYQAAAAGIGKTSSEAGDHSAMPGLTRTTSHQTSRPASVYGKDDESEHGIPHIGSQIPLFPGAGDVQAPTPTPSQSGFGTPSTGQAKADRHHSRTKSGREVFHGPPGSYGMHGHGHKPTDPLEKAWYQKHPAEQARESSGVYSPAIIERKEYTMSSEQLNKLVHSNHQLEGMGSTAGAISTPSEQIGYLASEEYTHRLRRLSSQIQDSPLRRAESIHGDGMESETEHDPIHIDPPTRRMKGLEVVGLNPAVADNGQGETEGQQEFDIPILASDEASYRPEARYMQPAVDTPEPQLSRRGSRTNMVQLGRLPSRGDTTTPLDNVKEYEPLFPEDDDDDQTRAAKLHLLKKKRPDLARHHFPSHDIWEDTPDSLMYETTVEAEQSVDTAGRSAEHEPSEFFETPEAEKARQQLKPEDQQNFVPKTTIAMAKGKLNPDVLADMPAKRPSMRNRFPSQDVWEDTPDSAMYTTVVDEQDDKPQEDDEPSVPQIPARPTARQAPGVPERPKPQVPSRPAARESGGAPLELTKTTSSEREAPALKPKPSIPARPVGSKIASLQAGFMNDLNNRLKLGPQAPPTRKEEQPLADDMASEEEKAPLADARKGRAKGPSRRKPGVSPSATEKPGPPAVRFSMMTCMTVWEIDEDEVVINKPVMPIPESTPTDLSTKPHVEKLADDKELDGADTEPTDIQLMTSHDVPADKAIDGHATAVSSKSTDTGVQTGEKAISIDDGRGEIKKMTAIEGGIAHPAGDAVVEHMEGKEHVSGAEPDAE